MFPFLISFSPSLRQAVFPLALPHKHLNSPLTIISCNLFLGYAHFPTCTNPSSPTYSTLSRGSSFPFLFRKSSEIIPNCFTTSSAESHTSPYTPRAFSMPFFMPASIASAIIL